ncbi:MAG: DNRLRE domain-containing protein [candidate division KSB1 bacterium]|nr:DNRLRE domain-containing protein [candidate division KSB1 bacterium]
MHKHALALILMLTFITPSSWAQTFDLRFVVVADDGVTGGHVDLKVQLKANGTSFRMGSGNLVFTYNPARFSQPTLLTAHNFNGSQYTAPTVTEPASGRVSANFEYNGSAGNGTTVGTSFLDVVTIRFTINDPGMADTLRWRTVSPNGVNVFSDDNATQIVAGTLASLIVLPPPGITSFTPASGPVGTEVTISGNNFSDVTQVIFNGQPAASFVIDSATQIRAIVPAGASTGRIVVSNGSSTATSNSDFVVTSPTGTVTVTLTPEADTHISKSKPTSNYGTASTLRFRNASSTFSVYLKFEVTGISGTVQRAVLRLYATTGSNDTGSLYSVSNNYAGTNDPWTETGLTWNNADRNGVLLTSNGPITTNAWIEFNITTHLAGNGTYSFAILNATTANGYFSSREGSQPPQLVIEYSPGSGNAAPVANNDSASTTAGTAVTINVLANDSDSDGTLDPASVTITTAAANGTTSVNSSSGAVTYTPNPGFAGSDSFAYTVRDNAGATSNAATVSITVNPGNAAPVANNDSASTTAGTAVTINVLANDSDSDGTLDPASVTITTAAANGTTSVNSSSGAVTYTPNPGFAGSDSFAYTVRDNAGATSNAATVSITVSNSTISSLTFTPIADAYTSAENPDNNYGSEAGLRFRYSNLTFISYLKFEVAGITGSVQSAKLRVYVTTGSNDNATVYSASNYYVGTTTPWTESGLTWNNADRNGGALATQGPLSKDAWYEWDVTAAVSGNGTVSLAILNNTTALGVCSSREGANPPQLVVEFGSSALPRPNSNTTTQTLASITANRLPADLQLLGNHPNPFYSHTTITYALPEAAPVSLIIYNLTGQVVRKLVDGVQPAGYRQTSWNGRDKFGNEVPTGVYFMRLQSGDQVRVKRMILQR